MSYDITIFDKHGDAAQLPLRTLPRGSIYRLIQSKEEGDRDADVGINITYNYSGAYYYVWPEAGIRVLDEMPILEAIPKLESAVWALGTVRSDDYWESTNGNAGAALNDVLTLCRRIENPERYKLEVS